MENATKAYTNEAIDLLIGQIRGTKYTKRVQEILSEMGHPMEIIYIQRCVNRQFYSEVIWDAIVTYLEERKRIREEKLKRVYEVVS